MEKILFNLVATQPDTLSKRHGGGKYGEVVFRRMVERRLPIACYYDSNRWLNPEIRELIERKGIELYDHFEYSLKEISDLTKASVIYTAQYTKELADQHEIPVIGTIHGLRGLETPWDSDMINYRPVKNAMKYFIYYIWHQGRTKREKELLRMIFTNPLCKVVTVSHHSSSSIKCYLPQYKNRVIPVFYSPSTSATISLPQKYDDKYFLIVSANRSYKNGLRAIRALDRLFENGDLNGFKVKVTGASSWDAYRYKPSNADKFEFYGFVDEQELEQLYHDAYCLVYPSLNEGFGYPPLEAMHYGTPVICSSFSSIPEVCGDAVLYFNPLSVEEIMSRILLITDEKRYKKYCKKALARYDLITKKQHEDLDALIDFVALYTTEKNKQL